MMDDKGGLLVETRENGIEMMALCLQCVLILASMCIPGTRISLVGFHEMLSLILTIYQQL